jgi:hypothetical protein
VPESHYEAAVAIENAMAPVAMQIVTLGFALEGDDRFKVEQARNLYYAAGRLIREVADGLRDKETDS